MLNSKLKEKRGQGKQGQRQGQAQEKEEGGRRKNRFYLAGRSIPPKRIEVDLSGRVCVACREQIRR
jgi:ribosomal protein L44E